MNWKYLGRLWDSPEATLKRKLREDPLYPFEEREDVYYLGKQGVELYVGLFIFFVSAFVGTNYWYQQRRFSNELFDTLFILFFLYSLRLITYYWQKRVIEVEKDGEQYYFYLGGKLVYTGKIHNIYIRLRGQRSSNGCTYHRLILNGYNVEEQDLTGMTTNKAALESMGRIIAGRLNINYFDSDDVSVGHVVRHLNPYSHYLKPHSKKKLSRRTKRVSVAKATLDAFY